jgi:hypothetical protein
MPVKTSAKHLQPRTSPDLLGGSGRNRILSLVALLLFLSFGAELHSQQKSGGNQSQGPGQQSQQNSPGANGPSPGGITGGTDPIESVLFSYKALTSDGAAISSQVTRLLEGSKGIVVIASPTDVSALVQWRSVMGQLRLLTRRAENSDQLARPDIPQYSASVGATPPSNARQFGLIAGAADIQTLAQTALTLASAFAVNESLNSSAGAITDVPLTNVVARDLRISNVRVFVPSIYPSSLLRNSDLSNTFIWDQVTELEDKRRDILSDIQEYLQALDDARTVAASTTGYSLEDKEAAKRFANEEKTIGALVADLNSIVVAIDTFEGSLFSGQTSSPPPNPQANVNQQQIGNPANSQQSVNPPNTQPARPGVNQNLSPQNNNATPPPPQAPAQATPLAGGSQQAGTTLQQIMFGDLLAHEIWNGIDPPDQSVLDTIHVLSVHSLESGGGQLTKSNLFVGSRIYFSGGAVATFSLFGVNGEVECAGYAYDYSGYIREKNFDKELRAARANQAVITTDGSCLRASGASATPPAAARDVRANQDSAPPELFSVRIGGKFGYMNSKRRIVIRAQFTKADDFSESLAAAYIQPSGALFPVAGYIDTQGHWVIKPRFVFAGPFHGGFARVKLSDNFASHALVSSEGQIVPVPGGDDLRSVLGDVVDGVAVFSPDGSHYGFIDPKGAATINPQFEDADAFSEGLALVKSNGRFGFVNKMGSFAITPKFMHATDFHNGRALVCVEEALDCGSIDKAGTLTPIYAVLDFEQWGSGYYFPRPPDASGLHVIRNYRGYSDESGKVVIPPKYYMEFEFSEGLAAQMIDENGGCGYIDSTGKMVIPAIYTGCDYFSKGYAAIARDDQDAGRRYGYIDNSGRTFWLSK